MDGTNLFGFQGVATKVASLETKNIAKKVAKTKTEA